MKHLCLSLLLLAKFAANTDSWIFGGGCSAVNCAWGSWGSWYSCAFKSGSCGTGISKRLRPIKTEPSCGGSACYGLNYYLRSCSKCCRVNCAWGSWGSWGNCAYKSGSCGSGSQTRRRSFSPASSCGGSSCSGSGVQHKSCSKCCPVNCAWEGWGSWSTCAYKTGNCGSGTQTRRRSVSRPSSCGGSSCSGTSTSQRSCSKCCPVNCVWDCWGAWGPCAFLSGTCGSGNANRSRSIRQQASCGGSCPGSNTSSQVCHKCCPHNCKWSSWGPWTECSKECGGGMRRRSRTVTSLATCGGSCPGTHEKSSSCNTKCCPVDCTWAPWSSWSKCRGECPGEMRRRRKEKTAASCGGTPCSNKDSRQRKKCKRPC